MRSVGHENKLSLRLIVLRWRAVVEFRLPAVCLQLAMKHQKEMEQLEKNQREQLEKLEKFNEQVRKHAKEDVSVSV